MTKLKGNKRTSSWYKENFVHPSWLCNLCLDFYLLVSLPPNRSSSFFMIFYSSSKLQLSKKHANHSAIEGKRETEIDGGDSCLILESQAKRPLMWSSEAIISLSSISSRSFLRAIISFQPAAGFCSAEGFIETDGKDI